MGQSDWVDNSRLVTDSGTKNRSPLKVSHDLPIGTPMTFTVVRRTPLGARATRKGLAAVASVVVTASLLLGASSAFAVTTGAVAERAGSPLTTAPLGAGTQPLGVAIDTTGNRALVSLAGSN